MVYASSLLASTAPTAIAPAEITIGHVQLRDLIICPREAGIVNYIRGHSIIEHDLNSPDVAPKPVADLSFIPNTLSSLNLDQVPDSHTLLAAGGLDAEIHLSLHSPSQDRALWHFSRRFSGSSNNSIILSRACDGSHEPRLIVSNNDGTVRIYEVPLHGEPQNLRCCGSIGLQEPVNHSSISPDGRTLLSVGDSPRVYLHSLSCGAQLAFNRTTTLRVPPPTSSHSFSIAASLSTAWSADGLKFAVASQEGVIAIWDVRSTIPVKVLHTSARGRGRSESMSYGSGWSVRNVKFGCGGVGGRAGHEIMTYTEDTNFLHVLDARTFETEEIIHVPKIPRGRYLAVKPRARSFQSIDGIPSHGAARASLTSASFSRMQLTDRTSGSNEDDAMNLEEPEVGIAGMCFDPTGGFLYVATTDGVAEWTVRGSGERQGGSRQLLRQEHAVPSRDSNNKSSAKYVNDFWGDGTNHIPHRTPRRSAHLTSTMSRPRNFSHFLRVTPRLVDAFTMPLQLRRWNFNPFAGKNSVCTGDVAPARDEDRYGIAPPSAAEVAAAMQEVCDSSAQQGQAAAEAPQVSIQRPPTQVIPGKSSALGTEELSYMTGCCGFHLFRRRSTSHQ